MKWNWLLLRGLSREKRHWWSFPQRLAEITGAGRVVCLDLPGFGTEHARRSPSTMTSITDDVRARLIAARRDHDDDEDDDVAWGILGISLGGMVALDWCTRYPDDFARCVTINTSSARLSSRFERFRLAGVRNILATLPYARNPFAKERGVLRITSNEQDEAKLDAIAKQQAEWLVENPPRAASLALQLRAAMTFEVSSSIPLRVPALILASTADRLVSHRCSEKIAAHLNEHSAHMAHKGNARLVLHHDGGGHDLSLDAPDWICTQIREWEPCAATQTSAKSPGSEKDKQGVHTLWSTPVVRQ